MELADDLKQIARCRYPSGLYSAVPTDSEVIVPVYRSVWLRDTVYTLLAFEAIDDVDSLRDGLHALLDRVLLRWSFKLDWRIREGVPENPVDYLHPRFDADGNEIPTELWGLRQDDAVGLVLWGLARWHERYGLLRNDHTDFHLLQKLVWYLDRIDHPHVPDNGIWEEEGATQTVHYSSVAAVAAGVEAARRVGVKDIPERLARDAYMKLVELDGRESDHHATDLALLTAVWPLGDDVPVPRSAQRSIVERVERELAGARGVVRYHEDTYHVCHGGPPEWTMGLGFLALAWDALGDRERATWYLHRLEHMLDESRCLPEAWCREPACAARYNSPLAWSHALHVIAHATLRKQSIRPQADVATAAS